MGLFLLLFSTIFKTSVGIELSSAESGEIVRALGGSPVEAPIVMFVTAWCPACRYAQKYLQARNINYIHADIEKNHSARLIFETLSKKSGRGIPQILVGDLLLVGFDEGKFEQAQQLRSNPQ